MTRLNDSRRRWLQAAAVSALAPWKSGIGATEAPESLLRRGGGIVVLMRHASAPGTFDPPGFRLGECGTQRNLDEAGRAQARGIGAWYRERGLVPVAVRSSRWCRCLETARLAFDTALPWAPLDSIIGAAAPRAAQTATARAELARLAVANATGFEVWVTHQVNVAELAGPVTDSGESVIVRHDPRAGAVVLGTWRAS